MPAAYLALEPIARPPAGWIYPLTEHRRRQLHALQGGRCAICRTTARLVVDHAHVDGRPVRGLLCACCNAGLGHFRDSTRLLHEAIRYLNAPPLAIPPQRRPTAASVSTRPLRGRVEVRPRLPTNPI